MTQSNQSIVGAVLACAVSASALAGGTDLTAYQSFGTYAQGFECGVFNGDDGTTFQINGPIPRGTTTGDRIHVDGLIDPECFSLCFLPCLVEVEVSPALETFGTIQQGFECLILETIDGGLYQIEPQLPFSPGDFVQVQASIDGGCFSFCGLPCLENVTLTPAFSGCGELIQGIECLLFQADSGETYQIVSDDLDDFTSGDRVFVQGPLDPECASFCFSTCLHTTTLESASADLNCDQSVTFDDLLILLSNWGQTCEIFGGPGCESDIDNDGVVGFNDLLILLASWS